MWDNRSLEGFRWSCIFDVFSIVPQSDYLFVNVPLWFLLCLFVIQLIYYFLSLLPRWVIITLIIGVLLSKKTLLGIASPFMFNNALYWGGFYALGHLTGHKYMEFISTWPKKLTIAGILATVFLLVYFMLEWHLSAFSDKVFLHAKIILFTYLLIVLFSCLNNNRHLRFLRFYGSNSLIVLGMHVLILIPIERLSFKLTMTHSPWLGLCHSIITAIILVFIIRWMNKYIPQLVAKKDFFRKNRNT